MKGSWAPFEKRNIWRTSKSSETISLSTGFRRSIVAPLSNHTKGYQPTLDPFLERLSLKRKEANEGKRSENFPQRFFFSISFRAQRLSFKYIG